jgi:hypothetical protein
MGMMSKLIGKLKSGGLKAKAAGKMAPQTRVGKMGGEGLASKVGMSSKNRLASKVMSVANRVSARNKLKPKMMVNPVKKGFK